ncbi:MAG: hypothetical protein ACPGED_09830 [Flavobacteriales bacterium]
MKSLKITVVLSVVASLFILYSCTKDQEQDSNFSQIEQKMEKDKCPIVITINDIIEDIPFDPSNSLEVYCVYKVTNVKYASLGFPIKPGNEICFKCLAPCVPGFDAEVIWSDPDIPFGPLEYGNLGVYRTSASCSTCKEGSWQGSY